MPPELGNIATGDCDTLPATLTYVPNALPVTLCACTAPARRVSATRNLRAMVVPLDVAAAVGRGACTGRPRLEPERGEVMRLGCALRVPQVIALIHPAAASQAEIGALAAAFGRRLHVAGRNTGARTGGVLTGGHQDGRDRAERQMSRLDHDNSSFRCTASGDSITHRQKRKAGAKHSRARTPACCWYGASGKRATPCHARHVARISCAASSS